MKYSYDASYRPAFPAVEVVLHNLENERQTKPLSALLDSGADGTLVPLQYLEEVLAPVITETRIRSHWGEWRYVEQFLVEIEVGEFRLSGVLVVGDEIGDEVVLGRDVMNKLRVLIRWPSAFGRYKRLTT